MDFKRVETIFLVAFLGLNLFLFSIYQEGLRQASEVAEPNRSEMIEQRLKKDEIDFPEDFSGDKKEGYYLSAEAVDMAELVRQTRVGLSDNDLYRQNTTITNNMFVHFPEGEYAIDSEEPLEGLNHFLQEPTAALASEQYVYMDNLSDLKSDKKKIVAAQSYEGIPFEDETAMMDITVEDQNGVLKIVKYTETQITNIEQLREKMELISEREAISTLYVNNKLPKQAKIVWTKLAYSRIYQVQEKNVYVPMWFVAVKLPDKTTQIESVHAINKTITTGNLVRKVEN